MFLVTLISAIGIALNISFIIVICKNKRTKKFQSPKPFRQLLIAILISDIWYLLNKLDIRHFYSTLTINFTAYNGICQLNAYLNVLFSILLEFHMLFGSFTLFRITFKENDSKKQENVLERKPKLTFL